MEAHGSVANGWLAFIHRSWLKEPIMSSRGLGVCRMGLVGPVVIAADEPKQDPAKPT